MSTKTSFKRVALVAVAALGMGVLTSVSASATESGAVTAWNIDQLGITSTSDVSASSSEAAIYTRVGQTITVQGITWATASDTGSRWRLAQITGPTTSTAPDAILCASAAVATTTCTFTATAAMNGKVLRVQGTAAGAAPTVFDTLTDLGVTINVVDATAPKSVSWEYASTTSVSPTSVDYAVNVTPKDASGVATILLDNETISVDVSPQTGVTASQVIVTDASKSEAEPTAAGATTYAVNLDGDPAGATGSTIAGTEYLLTAQLLDGSNAVGAPASAKYKRLANTASLAGTLVFTSDSAGTTAVTSVTTVPTVATPSFYVKAVDANGGVIKGATVAITASAGTVTYTSAATTAAGMTNGATLTPADAGSYTVTATITTGTTSITKTLSVVATAISTLAPASTGWLLTKVNGSGVVVEGATTPQRYKASLNTTAMTATLSGLTANTAVKITTVDTSTLGVKINGIAAGTAVYPVADSTGKVSLAVTLTGTPANSNAIEITADGATIASGDTALVITFTTAAKAITTSPANGTVNFAKVSSTNAITVAIADQYGNPQAGGSVVITNTSVPSGVTAMTTATVAPDATGKATVNAIVGATAGTYVFTVDSVDANNSNKVTSTITYTVNAAGAPGSLAVTSGSDTGTTLWAGELSPNGLVSSTGNASSSTSPTLPTAGGYVTVTAKVTTDGTTGIDGVSVGVAGTGVALFSSTSGLAGAKILTGVATSVASAGGGVATIYAVCIKAGTGKVTFTAGSLSAVASFTCKAKASTTYARTLTLDKTTAAVKTGTINQITATVTDVYGNPVAGVSLTGTVTGAAGRLAGGARQISLTTDAKGQAVFETSANEGETGSGTLTVTGTSITSTFTDVTKFDDSDYSANGSFAVEATDSATSALTISAGSATSISSLTALVNSLIKKINAMQSLLNKIQKKLGVK